MRKGRHRQIKIQAVTLKNWFVFDLKKKIYIIIGRMGDQDVVMSSFFSGGSLDRSNCSTVASGDATSLVISGKVLSLVVGFSFCGELDAFRSEVDRVGESEDAWLGGASGLLLWLTVLRATPPGVLFPGRLPAC